MFKYISILLLFGASLFAQSENDRLDRLEKQIKELNEQNQQQKKEIDALKKKDSSALDKELAKLPEEKDPDPKLNRLRLIEFSGNIMGAVGGSTANNERLEELQGGGHDPRQRGFNLQQIELGISAQIDPFLRAEALILYAEEEVELEEAYILTTALPFDLELELGYMLTEFAGD